MASTSKIEDIIDEIEAYIDDCKPSAFSTNKIVVNRDELESLIQELRTKTPDEIKKYQRMIANREQILADAKAKADEIISQAQVQTNEHNAPETTPIHHEALGRRRIPGRCGIPAVHKARNRRSGNTRCQSRYFPVRPTSPPPGCGYCQFPGSTGCR